MKYKTVEELYADLDLNETLLFLKWEGMHISSYIEAELEPDPVAAKIFAATWILLLKEYGITGAMMYQDKLKMKLKKEIEVKLNRNKAS